MTETKAPKSSEEQMARARIGPLQRLDAPVVLVDYDPTWPASFEREAARIRRLLGERIVLLGHVGSTSVPGLAAKPRIDVLLVVPSSADEASYVPALESERYVLKIREPDWYEHRVLGGPDVDANIHVFSRGCAEAERMLRFRDWLRTHADDRMLYERTKRELASRTWEYTQHYADAKTQVVQEILARALGDRI